MDKINIAFFTNQQTITALEYLRIIGPISHSDMNMLKGLEYKDNIFECINKSDVVIVQRDFPKNFNLFSEILKLSRRLEKPLIYDLDDNLFSLSENHPDRKSNFYSDALVPMLMAALEADYLTVSNEYLQQKLSTLNHNIFILPNLLDETIWPLQTPRQKNRKEHLTIGYMGGDSHFPDIDFIAPILLDIKAEYSNDVSFHFYGLKPPDSLLTYSDTIWTPVKTYDYKEFADDFQKLNVDLFIAPLIDNEFNRCKSPIKFFEYSSLGVPGIFSDVHPYRKIIEDGETGFLASSQEEWAEKIRILLNDSSKRQDLAKNAQDSIRNNYLMRNNSHLWEKTYQKIINQGISNSVTESISTNFLNTIMEQLLEYHENIHNQVIDIKGQLENGQFEINSLKSRVDDLQEQKRNLEQEVAKMDILQTQNIELEQEVLFYALSKSWQITRPLRKINRFLRGKN